MLRRNRIISKLINATSDDTDLRDERSREELALPEQHWLLFFLH